MTTDFWGSPCTALYKRCPYRFTEIPPTPPDLRVTSELSPHYQRFPPRLTHSSHEGRAGVSVNLKVIAC